MSEQAGEPGQAGQHGRPGGFASGARIASYLLQEKIGQGGMAVVFRAYDERLDRTVALKILEPSLAADEAFRQRFIRESRAAAAVDDPHIIPVFEAGEANGVLFIAMRYVPGGDVLSLADADGRLSVRRAAEITSQAASALDAAHARGLVHRDVKPANMLVDPGDEAGDRQDHVYLSDFGLSKWSLQNTGLTDTGMFLGTVDYSAPEQIEGRAVDGRADQYSLACAAFQMLTGAAPFHRAEAMSALYAHVSELPPALTDKRPDLPMVTNGVFARALAKKPSERYPTCREFAAALRGALGVGGTSGTGHQRPHPVTQMVVPPPRNSSPHHSSPGAGEAVTPRQPQPVPDQPWPAGYQFPAGYQQPAGYQPAGYTPPLAGYLRQPIGFQQPGYPPVSYPQPAPKRRPRTGAVVLIALSVLIAAGLVGGAFYLRLPKHTTSQHGSTGSGGSGGSAGSKASGSKKSGSPGSYDYSIVRTLSPDPATADPTSSMTSVTWNSAGTLFETSNKDDNTWVWSTPDGHQVGSALSGSAEALAAAISPDGSEIAIGYSDGSISMRDVKTGQVLTTFDDPDGEQVDSVAFNAAGTELVSSDENGYAYIWSVTDGGRHVTEENSLLDPAGAGVWSAAFGSDGMLATGDYSGNVYVWNLSTGSQPASFSLANGCDSSETCSAVTALAFSNDGRVLAAGDMNGNAELWNTSSHANSTLSVPSAASGDPVWAASFGGSDLLALADDNGYSYLYKVSEDGASASQVAQLADPGHGSDGVGALGFSPNGAYLVTGDTNGDAYLWHLG
ncbi:MAG TPA: protein kinase [Streptosporangiaceae bacterium]|nr:protein kinase [Streptosporangiaceae bacterium]